MTQQPFDRAFGATAEGDLVDGRAVAPRNLGQQSLDEQALHAPRSSRPYDR